MNRCWPGERTREPAPWESGPPEPAPWESGPPEPAPWATGLTVTAIVAGIVTIALINLSQALAINGRWLVVLGNLLVAAGLAPSLWLGRATPIWRWVVYGVVAGILLTWVTLLFSLL